VEYLVIISLLAAAILPFLLLLAASSTRSPEQLALSLATFSASRMAAAVNSVGSLGPGAALRIQVELPENVAVSASGREITISLNTSMGPMDIVQPVLFPLSSQGLERIRAGGSYVIDVYGPQGLDDKSVSLVLT
jgi:hypothetical protein